MAAMSLSTSCAFPWAAVLLSAAVKMRYGCFFLPLMNKWDACMPYIVMPPLLLAPSMVRALSVLCLLPLGLAPCSSGEKITGSLCLLTRSSCSFQLQHWHFYSELGFLSIGLFTHSASLIWPHRDFPTAWKKFTLQNPLFSECILRTCRRAVPVFLPVFQNCKDGSGEYY